MFIVSFHYTVATKLIFAVLVLVLVCRAVDISSSSLVSESRSLLSPAISSPSNKGKVLTGNIRRQVTLSSEKQHQVRMQKQRFSINKHFLSFVNINSYNQHSHQANFSEYLSSLRVKKACIRKRVPSNYFMKHICTLSRFNQRKPLFFSSLVDEDKGTGSISSMPSIINSNKENEKYIYVYTSGTRSRSRKWRK